ncbi:hypothetical protein ACFSC6_05065 [Rufibacter sediminis]|uniref:IPT/TIG domain-containing protein n=1 Tax=Rufibacter sediminis TaxID=2762756 RepID=A0ABR6VRY3_9BACT|nr:hypothetical protein [Rufibacter sediminis]MBC3539906.1 hypothetical protein [Rufibacter sediminis]
MKNFYSIRTLLLALFVVSLGFFTSCGDDDENALAGGQVQLLSFGPTGAKHGEEIRFIGHNLDQVESVEMQGATVAKAQFIEQTSTLIRLTVPEEAMAGKVTLKLSTGDNIVSKTDLSFEVPITVTDVTAEARPGGTITITGTKLTWVDSVGFGNEIVKQFISQSATKIELQVPANAKTGNLIIYGGGENPTFLETEEELVITLPEVTSIAPASIRHNEVLTITGTNLDLVGQVNFPGGGQVTTFESQSATSITLKVPTTATNGAPTLIAKGSLVEVKPTQTVSIILPVISNITTVRHTQNTTITGTDLDKIKEITFPGDFTVAKANFVSQSATQIVVAVPAMAKPGALKFKTMHDFTVTSATNNFNVLLPSVSSYAPELVAPNGTLTINGTNLDLIQDITFGGMTTKVSAFLNKTATRLQVTVPTAAQTGMPKFTLASGYVVEGPKLTVIMPTVSSITPAPVSPRAYMTINGANLNLVKSVKFTGGAEVTTFLTQSESQIILLVPTGAQTGKLTLTTQTNVVVVPDVEAEIVGVTPLPAIAYALFADERHANWGDWSFGGTRVWDATDVARMGTKSAKMTYISTGQYGAIRFHATTPISTAAYSEFTFSVYGGSGTNDKNLNVVFNEAYSSPAKVVKVVEGKWTTYTFPISELGDIATVSDFLLQSATDWPGDIYLDHIGFR